MAELGKFDLGKIVPTFKVKSTTVATEGEVPEVKNVGTGVDVELEFKLPKGEPGAPGTPGTPGDKGATYKPTVDETTGMLSWELVDNPTEIEGEVKIMGPQGPKGDDFSIAATYDSVADMLADIDNPNIPAGSIVLISVPLLDEETGQKQYDTEEIDGVTYETLITDPDDPENARMYVKREVEPTEEGGEVTYEWAFLTDMSGASGIKGTQGDVVVPVYNAETGYLSWETKTAADTVTLPEPAYIKGAQGDAGLTPYVYLETDPDAVDEDGNSLYGHLMVRYDTDKQPAVYEVEVTETEGGTVTVVD